MTKISGWLNIYKEKGVYSNDLVKIIRKKFNTKKVGHAGTLDPMAEGVMVLAVGNATRLIQFLVETKNYDAHIYLGKTTDTLDAEGKVTSENSIDNINEKNITNVLPDFLGKIEQIPPMVSAVRHNGKRLYELAREGIEVKRKIRHTEVFDLKLNDIFLPELSISVFCKSGTYIRTIADDIGAKLGVGAHLSKLVRTRANKVFDISNAKKIDDITHDDLLDIDFPLEHLEIIDLDHQLAKRYLFGQRIFMELIKEKEDFSEINFVKVIHNNELVGIANLEGRLLRPYINFKREI